MRVGIELELLAPQGSSRETLARALAKATKKKLEFGFKFHGAGFLDDGRPDCRLTDAVRIPGVASFVDDPTISVSAHSGDGSGQRARADDVRIALWAERRCWASSRAHRLTPFRTDFDALLITGRVLDPLGHPLLVLEDDERGRERVCEVVLAPLARPALKKTLRLVTELATDLGFTVPREGATHAHYDAKPFRSTRALRSLILEYTKQRDALAQKLTPNPHCTKLGPFPPDVIRVAREADDETEFSTFCAALLLAGLKREVDLNLLGAVENFPKQPTIEFRALPATLDAEAIFERLGVIDAFL
ncbi:MAG: amidoligase family protein [Archangium sp.]